MSRVAFVVLGLACVVSVGVLMILGCDGVKQSYMLAFADSKSVIHVRWSEDGTHWKDGQFLTQKTDVGTGAMSDPSGIMRMVLWTDAGKDVRLLWGLGPAIWDSSPDPHSPQQVALSAPSAASSSDANIRLVAFRTQGDVVALRLFDISSRQFLSYSLAPVGSAAKNDQVQERPALTVLGNKVVLAWERSGNLQFAAGTLSGTSINWTNLYTFPLPQTVSGSSYGGISPYGPTLTHDGSRFYAGFARSTVRSSTSGTFLSRDDLFVYSSPDGVTWNLVSTLAGIDLQSYVNIASRPGEVIAATVAQYGHKVYRLKNGSWNQLDGASVFGGSSKYQHFALISVIPK